MNGKIGLTSTAIQQQLGVSEPDYGALWKSDFYEAAGGRVEIAASAFLQPRIEAEVAFLIRDELGGGHVTAEDVLAATEACATGVEIVDSLGRIGMGRGGYWEDRGYEWYAGI